MTSSPSTRPDHPSAGTVIAIVAVIGLIAATAIGAARWRDRSGETADAEALPPEHEPVIDTTASTEYAWATLPIGAGGFVTGLVAATSDGAPELYARTDVGGAYRFDPTTSTWRQLILADSISDDEPDEGDYFVASIAVSATDPEVVAVAVGDDFNPEPGEQVGERDGRVLWSTDGGATWRASTQRWSIAANQSQRVGREQLAIDPTDPTRALMGTQREGLWWTDDAGGTWHQVDDDLVPHGQVGAPEDDQTGVSSVSYFAPSTGASSGGGGRDGGDPTAVVGVTGDGIYATSGSVDEGWTRVAELDDGAVPSSATPDGDGLLVSINTPGRSDAALVRLTPRGSDRFAVDDVETPADASAWLVAVSPHDPDLIALSDEAVRDGHFWTSQDGGATWQVHDVEIDAGAIPWLGQTDLDDYMSAGRLLFDPVDPDRLWFAEGMAVWHTDEPTAPTVVWTAEATGIEEVVVSDIVVPPGGDLIVTVADRQGFRFTDIGAVPSRTLVDERFASGADVDYSGGHPERLAWIGAQSNLAPDQALPRGATSADGGATWQEMSGMDPDMYGGEVAVSATDPDRIAWLPAARGGAAPRGLFASDDGGRSWQLARTDVDPASLHLHFWWFSRRALAADRVDDSMYLMTDDARFLVSADGGNSWTDAAFAPPCRRDDDCHVYGQVQAVPGRAGHLWASAGRAGLFRTTDAGESRWRQVGDFDDAGPFGFGAPVGDAEHPAVYVPGTARGREGVWRSTDGGDRWELLSEHPGGIAALVNVVAGDPDVPGRVYVGFAGVGVVHGDPT